MASASACVCVPVAGRARYFLAARQAIASVLDRTPFDVVAAVGDGPAVLLPRGERVSHLRIETRGGSRAAPFLAKLRGLAACLDATRAETIMLLDADALIATGLGPDALDRALDGRPLAMVEQTRITGSDMDRTAFLDHYTTHALAWIAPNLEPPAIETFRFHNSGVVLGRTDELRRLTAWALDRIDATGPSHQVGRHMISDQDYFQVWTNSLHPSSCRTLDWTWNHCEHWDDGFPRAGARVLHYSNFCHGPTARTIARMTWRRRRTR